MTGEEDEAAAPARPPGVGDDAILRVLRVPAESAGMRLDIFLSTQLRATSRTRARAIVAASAFDWSGRRLRASERVRAEQRIALWRTGLDEEAPPVPLRIVAEQRDLLVIDKPALMTVHPTARHNRLTVIKQLEAARPGEYLALVHRLDRETSGVLLIARTRAAERELKLRLEERSLASVRAAERGAPAGEADKTYLAITWGRPAREGLISLPLERDPSPLRVKVRVSRAGEGLVARTGVEVLAETTGYALVRCDLFTGRQHQIRVHLAALGAPVVGDKLYGPEEALLARGADRTLTAEDLDVLELPRHALHAYSHRLAADGQASGAEYVAPLPRELADFWRSRGGTVPPELEAGAPLPRRSF